MHGQNNIKNTILIWKDISAIYLDVSPLCQRNKLL